MNNYELTIVLPGEVSSAKKKAVQERIEKTIKTNDGKVKKTDEWGKIDLSYRIKNEKIGLFIHFDLEIGSKEVKVLRESLRLDNDIIRYLLIREDK